MRRTISTHTHSHTIQIGSDHNDCKRNAFHTIAICSRLGNCSSYSFSLSELSRRSHSTQLSIQLINCFVRCCTCMSFNRSVECVATVAYFSRKSAKCALLQFQNVCQGFHLASINTLLFVCSMNFSGHRALILSACTHQGCEKENETQRKWESSELELEIKERGGGGGMNWNGMENNV